MKNISSSMIDVRDGFVSKVLRSGPDLTPWAYSGTLVYDHLYTHVKDVWPGKLCKFQIL